MKKFEDKEKYSVDNLISEIKKLNKKKDSILGKFKEEIQISCFKIHHNEIREKIKN